MAVSSLGATIGRAVAAAGAFSETALYVGILLRGRNSDFGIFVADVIITIRTRPLRRLGFLPGRRIAEFYKLYSSIPPAAREHVGGREEVAFAHRPEPAAIFPVPYTLPFLIPVLMKKYAVCVNGVLPVLLVLSVMQNPFYGCGKS